MPRQEDKTIAVFAVVTQLSCLGTKDAVLGALRKVNCAEEGGPGGAPPCRYIIPAGLLGPAGIPLLEEVKGG